MISSDSALVCAVTSIFQITSLNINFWYSKVTYDVDLYPKSDNPVYKVIKPYYLICQGILQEFHGLLLVFVFGMCVF